MKIKKAGRRGAQLAMSSEKGRERKLIPFTRCLIIPKQTPVYNYLIKNPVKSKGHNPVGTSTRLTPSRERITYSIFDLTHLLATIPHSRLRIRWPINTQNAILVQLPTKKKKIYPTIVLNCSIGGGGINRTCVGT